MTIKAPVSLAMGTYNGARYIGEQLESLAKQSVLPAELVVTDDASTDGTLDVVVAFAAKSPFPIRAEKNAERLGYRGNFMKAASLCTSPLIGFCDQDDVWMANKIAACTIAFDRPDILMTYHNATVTSGTLDPIGDLSSRGAPQAINPAQSLDPWQYGLGFTLMFRRDLMNYQSLWPQSVDYNQPQHNEAHDQWFFFLASALGTVGYIANPLVLYRQHNANTCGWDSKTAFKGALKNLAKTSATDIQTRQTVAVARARILNDMAPMLAGDIRHRAARAAEGYRLLAARYGARYDLYKADGTLSKIGMLAAFAGHGGYVAKNRWGVGRQALVRDVVRGIIFPGKSAAEKQA